ncbi:MAG: hypothetical protein ACRDHZ_21000, partial [Ktedonobacteraceae bacterium]
QEQCIIRARVVWLADDTKWCTDWQELRFSYASQSACDDEPQNVDVMHLVGIEEVDHARREAIRYNNLGDLQKARASLAVAAQAVSGYAKGDAQLQEELAQLRTLDEEMRIAPMAPSAAKEVYYQQQKRSRQQKDYRSENPD